MEEKDKQETKENKQKKKGKLFGDPMAIIDE
jgi:hypothetical protein